MTGYLGLWMVPKDTDCSGLLFFPTLSTEAWISFNCVCFTAFFWCYSLLHSITVRGKEACSITCVLLCHLWLFVSSLGSKLHAVLDPCFVHLPVCLWEDVMVVVMGVTWFFLTKKVSSLLLYSIAWLASSSGIGLEEKCLQQSSVARGWNMERGGFNYRTCCYRIQTHLTTVRTSWVNNKHNCPFSCRRFFPGCIGSGSASSPKSVFSTSYKVSTFFHEHPDWYWVESRSTGVDASLFGDFNEDRKKRNLHTTHVPSFSDAIIGFGGFKGKKQQNAWAVASCRTSHNRGLVEVKAISLPCWTLLSSTKAPLLLFCRSLLLDTSPCTLNLWSCRMLYQTTGLSG